MSDIDYMTTTQKRVLVVLCRHWRWCAGGNSWKSFEKLSKRINRPLQKTKNAVHELADLGLLEHSPMVDHDWRPTGSGYFLTHKARNPKGTKTVE